MPRYEIHAIAEGSATITVDAPNKDAAETIAYEQHLVGIAIEGGESTWNIESIEEVA